MLGLRRIKRFVFARLASPTCELCARLSSTWPPNDKDLLWAEVEQVEFESGISIAQINFFIVSNEFTAHLDYLLRCQSRINKLKSGLTFACHEEGVLPSLWRMENKRS